MNSTPILIQADIVRLRGCFYRKLDLFVCGDQSGRTSEPINPHTL